MHLKVIQQMSKITRSVGIPPLSDTNFEQALTTSANNLFMQQGASTSNSNSLTYGAPQNAGAPVADGTLSAPSPFNFQFFGDGSDDDSQINPLAGMGLSDEHYSMILQNIVNGDGFMGMMGPVGSSPNSSSSSPDLLSTGKRSIEDSQDERDGKRSRFEVIE